MENVNVNETAATENESEETATATADAPAFTLDSIKKQYFAPTDLAAAEAYLEQCSEVCELTMNWEPEKGMTEGYGIAVFPISKRSKSGEGNEVIGACAAEIPSYKLIAEHEKGAEFIEDIVVANLISQVANAVRPRTDGSTAGSIPHALNDFLEKSRGKESIKAFTAVAPKVVSVLRKRGITFMHVGMLRQLLQSKAFAESQFPKISQETWQSVGAQVIELAEKESLDPAVIRNWLANRDNAADVEIEDDAITAALGDLA